MLKNLNLIDKKKKLIYLPPEEYYGNREYKWKLVNIKDNMKYEKLATQMKFRLYQGSGKAIYMIGVMDNGLPKGISMNELEITLSVLIRASKIIKADINTTRLYRGNDGYIASMRISIKF